MKISVIIPLYNVEDYVTYCLESFENQSYNNFEIIIVNDGSTDDSESVIKQYKKQSEMTIHLINQENAGVSEARNNGINAASGECICFVDADDMVHVDFLKEMANAISKEDCDLVICGSENVPEDTVTNKMDSNEYITDTMNSYKALKKFLYREIISGVCFIMVKKEIFTNNNLNFAKGFRYSEDLEMMWKLIAHSKKIGHTKKKLYFYRMRNGSAMSVVDDKRMDGYTLMKGMEKYFQKVRPDFSSEFIKYGTARWVWATLWQIALASDCYSSFKKTSNKFNTKQYMKNLLTYPKMYVAVSSLVYTISPFIYYHTVRKFGLMKVKYRAFTS